MARFGYIFMSSDSEAIDSTKKWMQDYGCAQIIEEMTEHEKLRPQWKQLMANIDRGDELVLAKFSNAVRGSQELSSLIEFCRIKVVRIISIGDKIDSKGELFPNTSVGQALEVFGSLPEEIAALRRSTARLQNIQRGLKIAKNVKVGSREEREKTIVSMYNSGHSIDDIWKICGFKSRSSIFRILNKYEVKLNRGKFSGPLGSRKKNDTSK